MPTAQLPTDGEKRRSQVLNKNTRVLEFLCEDEGVDHELRPSRPTYHKD